MLYVLMLIMTVVMTASLALSCFTAAAVILLIYNLLLLLFFLTIAVYNNSFMSTVKWPWWQLHRVRPTKQTTSGIQASGIYKYIYIYIYIYIFIYIYTIYIILLYYTTI